MTASYNVWLLAGLANVIFYNKKRFGICKRNYNGKRSSKIIKYRKTKHNE